MGAGGGTVLLIEMRGSHHHGRELDSRHGGGMLEQQLMAHIQSTSRKPTAPGKVRDF